MVLMAAKEYARPCAVAEGRGMTSSERSFCGRDLRSRKNDENTLSVSNGEPEAGAVVRLEDLGGGRLGEVGVEGEGLGGLGGSAWHGAVMMVRGDVN
jgi:hypothetical protein